MTQRVQDIESFYLARSQYRRISTLGWLLAIALVMIASGAITSGILLWGTYTHGFTPYLKWQDALLSLSWFMALIALGGTVLAGRFLYALRKGYKQGMIHMVGNTIQVRDLSSENLWSIFWVMNSAFWCFIAALIGIFPAILIQWTLHLSIAPLMIVTTGIAALLGLVGLIISIVALSFIVVGSIGCISFCRKLGSLCTYELNGRTKLSLDTFVLIIIQPDRPESMIDLHLLSGEDQTRLLWLLRENGKEAGTSLDVCLPLSIT
jgi:hypothetical protein